MPRTLLIASLIVISLLSIAQADPLPAKWGTAGKDYEPVWDKACAGDRNAEADLKDGIEKTNHPAIKLWLYLLYARKECKTYTGQTKETRKLLEEAALVDKYPIAQSNLAGCYINADCGFPRDLAKGEELMREAANGGYGIAALTLASEYARHNIFPLQVDKLILADDLIAQAEKEGVPPQLLNTVRGELAEAESKPEKALEFYKSVKPTKYVAYRIKEVEKKLAQLTADTPVFAALAASTGDGGYGFAFDQPTEDEARARALQECESRQAGACYTKLVLQGRGCAAYNYASGGSPYGWGTAREKNDAQNRAADECRIRNGNGSCTGGTVWACNTRAKTNLMVLFGAKNDSGPAQVAGSGLFNPGPASGACRIAFRQVCENFKELTYNSPGSSMHGKRLDNWQIFGTTQATINLPGCENGQIPAVEWYKGKWTGKFHDMIPPELKPQIRDALHKFQAHVRSEYPKCGSINDITLFIASADKVTEWCSPDDLLHRHCEPYSP